MFNSIKRAFGLSGPDGASEVNPISALVATGTVGMVSASCCDSGSQARDEEMMKNVSQAIELVYSNHTVVASTITEVRKQLRALDATGDDALERFKDALTTLFQGRGLSAFPLLLIDGRIAFYGGVPTAAAIAEALAVPAGTVATPKTKCCDYE